MSTSVPPTEPLLDVFEQLIVELDHAGTALDPVPAPEELYDAACTLVLRALLLWLAAEQSQWPACLAHEQPLQLLRQVSAQAERGIAEEVSAPIFSRLCRLGRLLSDDGAQVHASPAAGLFASRRMLQVPCVPPTVESPPHHAHGGMANATMLRLLDVLAAHATAFDAAPHALGVIYEQLLEWRVDRLPQASIRVWARGAAAQWMSLDELDELRAQGSHRLIAAIGTRTGRARGAIERALRQVDAPSRLAAVHCGDTSLTQRSAPYLGLLDDRSSVPLVLPAGAACVNTSLQRRAGGSHYTPPALARAVVERTLSPLTSREALPADPAAAIEVLLALRVCDPAAGGGAFLIAACEHLSERLIELWNELPAAASCRQGPSALIAATPGQNREGDGEARLLMRARQLVFGQCLIGVDKDRRALDVAELCCWLATGDNELPLDVYRSRFHTGDSLVGLAHPQQLTQLRLRDERLFAAEAGSPTRRGGSHTANDPMVQQALSGALSQLVQAHAQGGPTQGGATQGGWAQGETQRLAELLGLLGDRLVEQTLQALPQPAAVSHAERQLAETCRACCADQTLVKQPFALVDEAPRKAPATDYLHWPLRFPAVFARGGFDAIVGNPPWVAYAGRAAQPLSKRLHHYYRYTNPAFFGYRTLHGIFVQRAAYLLRAGGRLGLVLPTSTADLDGYASARRAHDQLCIVDDQLIDFGDGAFDGVFQPCMALTSTRRHEWPAPAAASQWPLRRGDLSSQQAGLLGVLSERQALDPSMFGERGYQTRRADKAHFETSPAVGRVPVREGADIDECWCKPPRLFVDPSLLVAMFRASEQWQAVSVLVRQTARYPIAAVSDGHAFRNSILAAFARGRWSAHALVAYLNSTPVRWFHYHTFRDARQGMPQIKIGHLRSLPDVRDDVVVAALDALGRRLSTSAAVLSAEERAELDELVARGLDLDADALALMTNWYATLTSR